MTPGEARYGTVCPGCFETPVLSGLCQKCMEVRDLDALPVGTRLKLNAYQVGRILGRGGLAITYAGHDFVNNRKVAIKEYLPRDFARRPAGQTQVHVNSTDVQDVYREGRELFINEAEHLWRLRDKNNNRFPFIVEVSDCFAENQTAYLVMEYLGLWTLKRVLRRDQKLSWRDATDILYPIMEALEFIHTLSPPLEPLYHFDVAPDNIIVREQPKLIDFGSARVQIKSTGRTHLIPLKDGYSAYELYASDLPRGAHSDVYSMGATLVATLTGWEPPKATDRVTPGNDRIGEILSQITDVPPGVVMAISRAIAPWPHQRYPSVSSFQADLLKCDSRELVIPSPHMVEPPPTREKALLGWYVVTVLLVLISVSLLWFGYLRLTGYRDFIGTALLSLLAVLTATWAYWVIIQKCHFGRGSAGEAND